VIEEKSMMYHFTYGKKIDNFINVVDYIFM